MTRKIAATFLLSLIFLMFMTGTMLWSAEKAGQTIRNQIRVPARLAAAYSFSDFDGTGYTAPINPPEKTVLRGSSSRAGIVETIGTTTYDFQHNCTVARQVEHRAIYSNPATPYGLYIHFDWMAQTGDTLGQGRGIGYQAYEIGVCDMTFAPGGIRIESGAAGFVGIDAHNVDALNSWAVPTGHQNDDGLVSKVYFDFTVGGPVFGVFTTDGNVPDLYGYYQNDGVGTDNANIWPKIEWDIDGTEQVCHMLSSERGGATGDPKTISYYRRVGPYGTGLGTWSHQRVIDTTMSVNPTVASSPISDRVALVWNAPVDYKVGTPGQYDNQLENDIWYAISTDNGLDWASSPTIDGYPSIGHQVDIGAYEGANVTQYDWTSDYKAYCDISAVFAIGPSYSVPGYDDELHIVWGCRRWTDTTSIYRRQGAIFHWREATGTIKTVVRADWDTGGVCYGQDWSTDVGKPVISECDDKMYVLYTQFGKSGNPCGDNDADNNNMSGYLYVSVYDPSYNAWDRPQRVTATSETPTGCTNGDMTGPGTCNTEYWASMARYGRLDSCKLTPEANVLDIIYINDYAPGAATRAESGIWTVNPVNWATYACREAVPEAGYADDAGAGFGLCVGQPILVVPTTGNTSFVITLENTGLLSNSFTATAAITGGGDGHTDIDISPTGGTLAAGGGIQELTVTITTLGETNNVTVNATITIDHAADGSPRTIPVCITVTDDYEPLASTTLATTCKQLRVYNNGELSNNASNASLDYMNPPDPDDCADVYLFDGSPIVCREVEGTRVCYFTIYDNDYASDHAMRQITPLVTDNTNPDYDLTSAEFITGDTAIRFLSEYYVPTGGDDCEYIIEKLFFWNITNDTLYGVAIGQALDWDVANFDDGDHGTSDNESGYDAGRKLIYQYACYQDPCDSLAASDRYAGVASGGAAFKNYMTLENDVYVYTSGPFGNDAPLPADTMYGLMTSVEGYSTATVDSCEDMMTLVTFDVYDMAPNDTFCVVKILSTSRGDADGSLLADNIDAANAFINAHDTIKCEAFVCDCLPGDANGDGQVNVGDAVYIISYVFKGGPAPTPYAACSGDANGDCQCNVGDAVYTISYVFKGGPPPVSCETWVTGCGTPIH